MPVEKKAGAGTEPAAESATEDPFAAKAAEEKKPPSKTSRQLNPTSGQEHSRHANQKGSRRGRQDYGAEDRRSGKTGRK